MGILSQPGKPHGESLYVAQGTPVNMCIKSSVK